MRQPAPSATGREEGAFTAVDAGRARPVALRVGWATRLLLLALVAECTTGGGTAAKPAPVPTQPAVTATGPGAVPDPAPEGTWRRIGEAPVPPAAGMTAAWTGKLLVVWGGQSGDPNGPAAAEGAAYDPAADRWKVLPAAPIRGRFGTATVWTGREVLVWGGQAGRTVTFADGAAYDPAADRWRRLAPAPIGPRGFPQATWTGREMIVWGGHDRCCPIDSTIHDPAAAAYDPANDRWRRIADVPPPWSGDDGGALTVSQGGRPLIWRRSRITAWDPAADRWSEVPGGPAPAAPLPPPGTPTAVLTTGGPFALGAVTVSSGATPPPRTGAPTTPGPGAGGDFLVWSTSLVHGLDGTAYRPDPAATGAWRRTANLDAQPGGALTAGGPDRIYVAAGQSARVLEYRIGEDRWSELPLPAVPTRSSATLVWTGTELLFWGGSGDEGPEMDGAAWRCC